MDSALVGSLQQQLRLEQALSCLKEYKAGTAADHITSYVVPLTKDQLDSWRSKQVLTAWPAA